MSYCEFKECKSHQPARWRVNENIGDGCFSVSVCDECMHVAGLHQDQDLPEGKDINAVLRAHYARRK